VLVAGDEFGPLGGVSGSDSFLLVPEAARATAVSVAAFDSVAGAARRRRVTLLPVRRTVRFGSDDALR